MLKKFSVFIISFLVIMSTIVSPAFADENFSTTLDTSFTVFENGNTFVEHKFIIKNKTPTTYISKYGMKLSSDKVTDIKVYSNKQKINPEIVHSKNQTSIGITFSDNIVGEGKTREVIISYNNPDIAQITGKVLEVNIPSFNDWQAYDNYDLSVSIPKSYGQPTRININPNKIEQKDKQIILYFKNLKGRGVSAISGSEQVFNLDLKYQLDNPNNQIAITQITLPPDTAFQKLYYHTIDPMPEKIEVDADGNWIADFLLQPNQKQTVQVNALALLKLEANPDYPVLAAQKIHFQADKFWELSNGQIQDLAQIHQTPQQIYDFVVSELSYTQQDITLDIERLGAEQALISKDEATCQEFTDLFIGLSRINQIPARRNTGYAYSENEQLRPLSLIIDVLHAWPEYYSEEQQQWIQIDPTWGNTTNGVDYFSTFDLNHIVFATNGKSSTLPYPAGSYKNDDEESKNVEVSFADSFPTLEPSFSIDFHPKKISFAVIPGFYDLIIKNNTGIAWYNLDISFLSDDLKSKFIIKNSRITRILPFQSKKIPIKVYNMDRLLPQKTSVEIQVIKQNQIFVNQTYEIKQGSKITRVFENPKFLLIMGISGVVITLTAWSIFIFGRKK
jgi:transglutaminase-like putative cysteine protease